MFSGLAFRFGTPIAFVLLLLVPFVADDYLQYLANMALAYIVIAVGFNVLIGYTGQFGFANAAFMGIGAYTTALLGARLNVPYPVVLPLSGLIAAVLGGVTAIPAMRMKTVYLAMVTMAFAQLCQWVFIQWKVVTLGTQGVSVPYPDLFGFVLTDDGSIYYLVLLIAAACVFVTRRLLASSLGRSFVAVRENEIMASCCGINVAATKMAAFCISAFLAGIGGSLFAISLRYVVPDGFGLYQLTLHFSMVLVGGTGSLVGSMFGALVLTALPEILRGFRAFQEIIYGAMLIIVVLFMPTGIAGTLRKFNLLPREILVRGWRAFAQAEGAGSGALNTSAGEAPSASVAGIAAATGPSRLKETVR
jgi:branched-chain amino acid transport system permease protein